jgi:superfamily II DNA/RNA helicase
MTRRLRAPGWPTARASATGVALTFINHTDMHRFARIEKLIEQEIYKVPLPAELGEGPEYNPHSRKGSGGKRHFHHKNPKPGHSQGGQTDKKRRPNYRKFRKPKDKKD